MAFACSGALLGLDALGLEDLVDRCGGHSEISVDRGEDEGRGVRADWRGQGTRGRGVGARMRGEDGG